jgi:hypothetical protein
MRFWVREAAGWLLLAVGLYVFYRTYLLLTDPGHYLIEAGPLAFAGFVIFRGGIHLLKVAVAARICLQAQERLRPERPAGSGVPRPARPAAAAPPRSPGVRGWG